MAMQQLSVIKSGEKIEIVAPFSAKNNAQYRSIGGKFLSGKWVLPNTQQVQSLIEKLWGVSESFVTINIRKDSDFVEVYEGAYQVGGYVICQRRFRDSPVEWAEGAWLVEGSVPSFGGSAKNPSVQASEDAVFAVVVREDFALANNLNVVKKSEKSKAELAAEKELLLKRLAEIDLLLTE